MKTTTYKGYRIYGVRSGSNLSLRSVCARPLDGNGSKLETVYGSPVVTGTPALTERDALNDVKNQIDAVAARQTAKRP